MLVPVVSERTNSRLSHTGEVEMYQHLTKLFLAGMVAMALLALGSTSIIAPAWADEVESFEVHSPPTDSGAGVCV